VSHTGKRRRKIERKEEEVKDGKNKGREREEEKGGERQRLVPGRPAAKMLLGWSIQKL
jgi:hypothetical protein